jgi:hypothetical protein
LKKKVLFYLEEITKKVPVTKEINLLALVNNLNFNKEIENFKELDSNLIEFDQELSNASLSLSFLQENDLFDKLPEIDAIENIDLLKKTISLGETIIKIHEKIQEEDLIHCKNFIAEEERFNPVLTQEESPLQTIAASNQAWVITLGSIEEKILPKEEILLTSDKTLQIPERKIITSDSSPCNYLLAPQNLVEISNINFQIEEKQVESQKELSKLVTNQITEKISLDKLGDTIKVSLYPEALGKITIECEMGEKLKIEIATEKLSTLALLQSHSSDLKENLVQKLQESLETELNFSMDKRDDQKDNKRNFYYYNLMPLTNEKVELYLIHNGLINFLV